MTRAILFLLLLCFTGAASRAAIPADPSPGEFPLYKKQLDSIEKTVPLDYNDYVASYIDRWVYRGRTTVSRMRGLSDYYFPIFETSLKEKGLPLELKYLSIVESALNPTAVSRVGATGLWQFMYTTAREYGLQMNSYVDERRDPVAASRAAAEYLSNMYGRYGDWLLAIASYNCGSGNVDRAIYKAGGKLDFWAIRPYLPAETRNYVPAYIAVTYIMQFADSYGIYPEPSLLPKAPVAVQIEKHVSIRHLSEKLEMDTDQLFLMNPKFKRGVINGSEAQPQTIWLPPVKAELYANLESGAARPLTVANKANSPATVAAKNLRQQPQYYKVRPGDNLNRIANRFGCSVQDLKVWNELKSTRLVPGQRLLVEKAETASGAGEEQSFVASTYKVRRGDTLLSIAARFNTSVSVLKELNGIRSASSLRAGSVIKIQPEG